MSKSLPGFYGFPDQLPPLPTGHSKRSPNNSEYLLDVPPALKCFVGRKLTVAEATFLVEKGYDVDVDVHGDPIASEKRRQSYSSATHLLARLRKNA